MIEEKYEGIPRNKTSWVPKIDYEKCLTCGKCVEYCHNRVFDFEEKSGKKKTVVKNPKACVVLSRGCEYICPAGAIRHPSEKKTRKTIEKLKSTQSTVKIPRKR